MGRLDIPRLKAEQPIKQMQAGLLSRIEQAAKEDEAAAAEQRRTRGSIWDVPLPGSIPGSGPTAGDVREAAKVYMDVPGLIGAQAFRPFLQPDAQPYVQQLMGPAGLIPDIIERMPEGFREVITPKVGPKETFQAFREGFQEGGVSGGTERAWEAQDVHPAARIGYDVLGGVALPGGLSLAGRGMKGLDVARSGLRGKLMRGAGEVFEAPWQAEEALGRAMGSGLGAVGRGVRGAFREFTPPKPSDVGRILRGGERLDDEQVWESLARRAGIEAPQPRQLDEIDELLGQRQLDVDQPYALDEIPDQPRLGEVFGDEFDDIPLDTPPLRGAPIARAVVEGRAWDVDDWARFIREEQERLVRMPDAPEPYQGPALSILHKITRGTKYGEKAVLNEQEQALLRQFIDEEGIDSKFLGLTSRTWTNEDVVIVGIMPRKLYGAGWKGHEYITWTPETNTFNIHGTVPDPRQVMRAGGTFEFGPRAIAGARDVRGIEGISPTAPAARGAPGDVDIPPRQLEVDLGDIVPNEQAEDFIKAINPSKGLFPIKSSVAVDDINKEIARVATVGETEIETLLRRHEGVINLMDMEASQLARAGEKSLRALGVSVSRHGREVVKDSAIDEMNQLFKALHGEGDVPVRFQGVYQKLRSLADWTEGMRVNFNLDTAHVSQYFYRGWKPPDDLLQAIKKQGEVGWPPGFTKPRVNATYSEMRALGFEPLSWNPFEQWRISQMQTVRFEQQMALVNAMKRAGIARPLVKGPSVKGWRVPNIGPAFEGKPMVAIDKTGTSIHLSLIHISEPTRPY